MEISVLCKGLSSENQVILLPRANLCILKKTLYELHCIPPNSYYCVSDGKLVSDDFDNKKPIYIIPRLCGGKGGFGSMLRAIGAQIEKTTNREACRDLSGRRLRDINEEQRLKKWISQQAEREREVEERKKRKLEKLASEPKHEFKDEIYDQERVELTERLCDSVELGMQASVSGLKRKINKPDEFKKRKKTILDEELSSDSGSEKEAEIAEDSSKKKINSKN